MGRMRSDLESVPMMIMFLAWAKKTILMRLVWANVTRTLLDWANVTRTLLDWANVTRTLLVWANVILMRLDWANAILMDLDWANVTRTLLDWANGQLLIKQRHKSQKIKIQIQKNSKKPKNKNPNPLVLYAPSSYSNETSNIATNMMLLALFITYFNDSRKARTAGALANFNDSGKILSSTSVSLVFSPCPANVGNTCCLRYIKYCVPILLFLENI